METVEGRRLTEAQKRELEILQEYGTITTDGKNRRWKVLMRLVEKGIAVLDLKYGNIFSLTSQTPNNE